MNKEKAQAHIESILQEGDRLVGFFQAIQPVKFWLFFLLGPLAVLSMKMYFVAVSKKGIYFLPLTVLGKFSACDFFAFNEIENVKMGKGVLQRPICFQFKNNRTIKVKAQLKGVDKIAKITPAVQQHIEQNIPLV